MIGSQFEVIADYPWSLKIAVSPIADYPIAEKQNGGLSLADENCGKSNRGKAIAESPVAENPIAEKPRHREIT